MRNQLIDNIEYNLERLLNRYVSGSNSIKVKDLLDKNNFELAFRWKKYINPYEEVIDIFEELIPSNFKSSPFIKKLILADPGVGKSTLSYSVYQKIFNRYKEFNEKLCPIYIDLAEYIGEANFGSLEWTNNYLHILTGESNIKWTKNPNIEDAFEIAPFFILDSLDEYLSNNTLNEIQSELNKYIFKEANVIGCRSQFYEFYISSSNKVFVNNFDKIILLEWNEVYHEKYTIWYFHKYSTNKEVKISDFVENLKHSKDLWELCKVPIRYNMILEILSKNSMNFSLVSKLISIYHNYITMTIQHESSRNLSKMQINDKLICLKKLAWNFYDEQKIGDSFEKIRFSAQTMKNLLVTEKEIITKYGNIDTLVDDLIKCSVLIEESNDEFQNTFSSIKFSHKSIQEYFVAKYIFETLITPNSEKELSQIYQSFIAQEIDQFFKDYIAKLNRDLILSQIACTNYINTFEQNLSCDSDSKEIALRKRIAKEQIAYNIGHLKTASSYEYLSNLVSYEKDEFLKRSMIIGLSFGGHFKNLYEYVDELREYPNSIANKINVAMHLSYFGDQPFDILNADVDQGLPKCSNTVKKLIHVINEGKNRGSWRIDLYTILYLSKYRDISIPNCLITIKENLNHFQSAITFFSNDTICKEWPETEEGKQLILKLKTNE